MSFITRSLFPITAIVVVACYGQNVADDSSVSIFDVLESASASAFTSLQAQFCEDS